MTGTPGSTQPGRQVGLALAGIVALGLALRVYRIGSTSLWYDEGHSLFMARSPGVKVWTGDVHPPLYFALLAVWRLVSEDDAWLRLPSALLGTATIPVVFALGWRLRHATAGLWAAALLAVLYFHVRYSQEARMYTLMVLLFALALLGLVIAVQQGRRAGWALYGVSASLLAYAQALGPFYVIALAALFPLMVREGQGWSAWRPWLIVNALVSVAFVPWVFTYLAMAREVRSGFWVEPSGTDPPLFSTLFTFSVETLPTPSHLLAKLGLGTHFLPGRWLWFGPLLLVLACVVTRVAPDVRRVTRALVGAYALPICLLTAISLIVAPVLLSRGLLPTVVPLVLLLGLGVEAISRWRAVNHLVLVVVAATCLLATAYYHRWAAKEDWRGASRYLQSRVQSGDLLLFNVDSAVIPEVLVGHYDGEGRLARHPRVHVAPIARRCAGNIRRCLDRAVADYPSGQRVWIVHSHERHLGGHQDVRSWLDRRVRSHGSQEFNGVAVEETVLEGPAGSGGG